MLDVGVFESPCDEALDEVGRDAVDGARDVEGGADDAAREEVRSVARLVLIGLRGERYLGLGYVHGLARGPEREYHDGAGREHEEHVCGDVLVQGRHHYVGRALGACDRVGVEARDGYADEVHKVVSGECEREGECSREDCKAQDVDAEELEERQQHGTCHPAEEYRQQQVAVYPLDEWRAVDDELEGLEECEVDDCGERCPAPEGAEAAEDGHVPEREYEARDPHHDGTAREGYDYREEYGRYYTHRACCVDELADVGEQQLGVCRYLVARYGHGRAQKAEYERYGCGCRQTHRVVDVEQDDVCEHDGYVECHDLVECEHRGVEHSVSGHLHHTAGGYYAEEYADGCDGEYDLHSGDFGADGRVEEVDCVVGDADVEARDGQNCQNDDGDSVYFAHS